MTYDAAGNMTSNGTYTYVYDAWDRLVAVHQGSLSGALVAQYSYDGTNRRIEQLTDFNAKGVAQSVTHYFLDGQQVVETRLAASASTPATSVSPQYQYIYSPRYIDAPILRDTYSGGVLQASARVYYLDDANYNVTALVNPSGQVLERYSYDAYGNVTVYNATWTSTLQSSSVGNTILFAGRELDAETGLYYNRARYYSAGLGNFISQDPAGFDAGDDNFYRYADNNPIICADPSGLRHIDFRFDAFIPGRLGTWLPEPGPLGWLGFYFKTDGREVGQPGTARLHSDGWIESSDIGLLTTRQPGQYSVSTRCDPSFRGNWSPVDPGFFGPTNWVWRVVTRTAVPSINTVGASNGHSDQGCESTITIQASASYPFGGSLAPNIDYTVHFRFRKVGSGQVSVDVSGTHDAFPDYEATVDNPPQLLSYYKTEDTGPGIINLNTTVSFSSTDRIVSVPTPP